MFAIFRIKKEMFWLLTLGVVRNTRAHTHTYQSYNQTLLVYIGYMNVT